MIAPLSVNEIPYVVEVYDPRYTDLTRYVNLQTQLDFLYPTTAVGDDRHVKFQVRRPQQEENIDHCAGLFAVANALAIAMGQESEDTVFDEARMRQHLAQCLRRHFDLPVPRRHSSLPRCLFTDLFINVYTHKSNLGFSWRYQMSAYIIIIIIIIRIIIRIIVYYA